MEADEENSDIITNTTKRQRAPLSDSEDNIPSAQGVNDGQKRRRLEPTGRENRSPTPSSSGRAQELMIKLDTPIIPSVRSRVQQLTQRREGGAPLAQRCLSDPGADSPSVIGQDVFREHHLGEGEFHQRMERFKAPVCQTSPTPSQSANNQCPRSLSNVISGIQQKLQGSATPSSKQASRIRQEREQELKQLNFHPICENAWLKRSTSDPSLSEQVDGDNKITDGSFTETLLSGTENLPVAATDVRPSTDKPCGFNGTAAPFELEPSHDEQLQMEREEQRPLRENRDDNRSHKNEEQRSLFPQTEAQRLSVSAGPNESEFPASDKSSSPESTCLDDMNLEEVTDEREPVEEGDKNDESSYGEGEIEMSTDEEFRLWRYPQDKACREESILFKDQLELESSLEDQEPMGRVVGHSEPHPVQDGDVVNFSCEASDLHTDLRPASKEDHHCSDGKSVTEQGRTRQQTESCEVEATQQNDKLDKDTDQCPREENGDQQSNQVQTTRTKEADGDLRSDERASDATDAPQPFTGIDGEDGTSSMTGVQTADHREMTEDNGETSKKVTFVLQPKLINAPGSSEIKNVSDDELSSHDETNTAEIIDQMFDEVLEYAGQMEREQTTANDITEDRDSGIGSCSGDKDKTDPESDKEKGGEEPDPKDETCNKSKTLEMSEDELLTFPPSGILSPLSKSVEAVVTPLRLAVSEDPPSLLLTPEDTPTPLIESAPLYSVDAYRTQRLTKLPTVQRAAPGVQSAAPEKPQPQPSINTKEKIAALNEEAAKLQTVINQTLQALSCCTDEEHGRGSFEEAEAEKLLVVSCEKRSALLAEVARLKEDRSSDSSGEDGDSVSQQPCRGTLSITNIQLPLKVEFVCSSHSRTGRPSHYFFVLIRYGPCNIVATPLATAADAQKGDTISFPTSVVLKDIRSTFEIDVEVYSLSHASGSNCSIERPTPRSRVTPRKLLNTITRASNSLTSAAPSALNTRRSSNFCLVGSHKITLASLGLSKFPLDKMKFEGKIRRLLGDEFQEKVPFLSPLEGHIYLQLHSESRSYVQHQGFLTMFEMVSGFGSWRRRYFSLEGWTLYYWNQPNDKENKEAEGSISLSSSPSRCVRSVNRDSCARPFTFELVSTGPQQQNDEQGAAAKCWFSADTKQDKVDWIERLSQALLDFNTWNRTDAHQSGCSSSVSGNLRESIL